MDCMKFCFKVGKTALETHKMLKEAFGVNAVRQTQTYKWFRCCKNGLMSFSSGRPSSGTIPKNVA